MSKFIAAMDNSGGSAGGVLDLYQQGWTDEDKMEKIHEFRLRMMAADKFNLDNIWGCILYKDSVDRGAVPHLTAMGIRSILKVDSGCNDNGTLKDFDVDAMCAYAVENGCYGTKMRSVVHKQEDLAEIVEQQFALARTIASYELIPIIEPEVPITHENSHKNDIEVQLLELLEQHLAEFDARCILKLTLPEQPTLYDHLVDMDAVDWVVALSGGYSLDECCSRLRQNTMGASFSRALSEGLLFHQTDAEFNAKINNNIERIVEASTTRITT